MSHFKRSVLLKVILVLVVSVSAYGQYSGGSGTAEDPYQIATAKDLILLGERPGDYDKHFILTADIDLDPSLPGGKVFDRAVIAPDVNDIDDGFQGTLFSGSFDGNDHAISRVAITGGGYLGLFGQMGSGAVVSNLRLEAEAILGGGPNVGSLVGVNNGSLSTCYSTGMIIGYQIVGGLVGQNCGSITASRCTGEVSGDWAIGGLVGENWEGNITESYSACVTSGLVDIGGLVGNNWGDITTCYSNSTASGGRSIGGLVGNNWGDISVSYSTGMVSGHVDIGGLVGANLGSVSTCYSIGAVSSLWGEETSERIGGLVGGNRDWGWYGRGSVSDSYWNIEVSGQAVSAGGIGMTTAEMKITSTYVQWWCPHVWTINEGNDYPHLWWEDMPGKLMGTPNWDGLGTANDPYLIYTVEQLTSISSNPCDHGSYYRLMSDFNLAGFVYHNAVISGFTGVLDGNGHIISNLMIEGEHSLGLFGSLASNAEIRNLGIVDVEILGSGKYIGAIAGSNSGILSDCYSTGLVSGERFVGGMVGWNDGSIVSSRSTGSVSATAGDHHDGGVGGLVGQNHGSVTTSYSTGLVSGERFVGGLVGDNDNGNVEDCYSTATVNGDIDVGGLVGVHDDGTLSNCHSTGAIMGDASVGGLVGYNRRGRITASYSISEVGGNYGIGGFVGSNFDGTITTSYSAGTVSGSEKVGGLVGKNSNLGSWSAQCVITASYSTCTVSGYKWVGGLVGYNGGSITMSYSAGKVNSNDSNRKGGSASGLVGLDWSYSSVVSSFWDIETSGQMKSRGGVGLTTEEMKDINAYLRAGWDFVDESSNGTCDYWQIMPDDYPQLRCHAGHTPVMPEGRGTIDEPYLIRDAGDLGTMWSDPMAHYRLEASVDLSGITWSLAVIPWFDGTFDGNGHVISSLHIEGADSLGFFGALDSSASILDLGLEAVDVNGIEKVGSLVGKNYGGTIVTSYSTGKVGGKSFVGGLVSTRA